jgi:4-hydroxybenzoate polyprenyltransferase
MISLRPKQWIKNIFIFTPLVFSLNFLKFENVRNSFIAFVLFSLITGSIYILNDCFDKNYDKKHPKKKDRPIASEKLSVCFAVSGAIFIILLSLFMIFYFSKNFFYISTIYIVLNILYSVYLKKIVILDVFIIATGFVLRVIIGGVIIKIELSPWILIVTFLLSMFLGFIKRRQELVKINSSESKEIEQRITLKKYNIPFLDQLISITTATTLISYISYVLNPQVQERLNTKQLYFTVPFVIFGIFRYLYLTYTKDEGESPEEVIFTDLPFTLNIVIWVFVFIFLLF